MNEVETTYGADGRETTASALPILRWLTVADGETFKLTLQQKWHVQVYNPETRATEQNFAEWREVPVHGVKK